MTRAAAAKTVVAVSARRGRPPLAPFAEKCIDGLAWNEGVLAGTIANSVGPYVELVTEAGYDLATEAARAPDSSLATWRR